MNDNPLAQLADRDVPPVPTNFEVEVHDRVNNALVVTHLLEFFLRAVPWALVEMTRAAFGATLYTLTGQDPPEERRRRRRD